METVVVGVAALLTSILSAVAGLGGGIILLAVIAQFFAPTLAIPIQGAVQLASNGSRAVFLRRDISWPVVARSSILLLPASLLGVAVATSLPEDIMRVVLAVFLLVVAWQPSLLRIAGGASSGTAGLLALGAASGFLNTTVGASGPFTSPFFKAVTATHVAFVATAACTQVAAHLSKLVAFGLEGFDLLDHFTIVAVGSAGVVLGSWLGTRLLGRLPETNLDNLFRFVLSALAIRMIWVALS